MSSRNDILIQKAARLTRRAKAFLYWENYGPIFLLAILFISLFLIGAFSGLWQYIGDPFRLIALIAAVIIFVLAVKRARQVKKPTLSNARRRVEIDAEVDHRPLDTIHDRPAMSDAGWERHYARAEQTLENIGPPKARPVLAPRDKYYLRFILPVALLFSLMIGTGDSFERLRHSLTPGWITGAAGDDVIFEAWVDPPAYTGRPPIYFKNTNKVEVPEGSELVARIIGTKDPTRLRLSGKRGSKHLALTRIGPDSFEVRAIVKSPSTARWRIGEQRKVWTIDTRKDTPPKVNFVRNPEADKRDRLTFGYALSDDYGVESLTLKMILLQDDEDAPMQIKDVDVPLGAPVRKSDDSSAALNLTKHEWAGKKVKAVLHAKDGLEQIAESEPVFFTVPDKIFIEPLAKAIVEQRGLVLAGKTEYEPLPKLSRKEWSNRPWFDTREPEFRMDRAPKSIERAALLIDAVTDRPEGLFQDPAVYMGLRNVAARLRYAKEKDHLAGIPEDLWNIAIRAEFGTLGTALQEMQEAEAALRDGIARRAPQREIDTLFDRYNEAVDRYREELVRQAIEDGNTAENGGGGGGEGMNLDQIQELLDAIEEANRQGDSEGARRALQQLAELLENMQIQLAQGGGGGGGQSMPGEMSEEMQESLEELADLLGEQRELRDETREAEQRQNDAAEGEDSEGSEQGSEQGEGQEGGQEQQDGAGAMTPQELAEQQQKLQEFLDSAREALPEPGEGEEAAGGGEEDGEEGVGIDPGQELEDALRAMRRAEDALERGALGEAQEDQADAVEALRNAGRALVEQARRNSENGQEANNENSDPLGRDEGDGVSSDEDADLDNRDNATRSRELQDEIRRRASEQEREKEERDYLERLLKRF